jgi:hypothetical protein
MRTTTLSWTTQTGWESPPGDPGLDAPAHLVLYFGSTALLEAPDGPAAELRRRFPTAVVAGCSTAGEIHGPVVRDDSLVVLAVRFDSARVRAEVIDVPSPADSYAAAAMLGRRLAAPDLRHVLVLSDGLGVNGTALTHGFRDTLPAGVTVTGGLAGDGDRFRRTVVALGAAVGPRRVVALGLHGESLDISYGSAGGWSAFGPRRLVTRSVGNILHTLDGQSALALYKRYLGELAADLPASGLRFPLCLLPHRDADTGLVRTILAVDETAGSLTFAGDIPEGAYVRLMRASGDALVAGAGDAARHAAGLPAAPVSAFALMVSCVGRKLVMGQRIEDEIEAARHGLGPIPALGFYSYGELCPGGLQHSCDLHNQTMTLTVIGEKN